LVLVAPRNFERTFAMGREGGDGGAQSKMWVVYVYVFCYALAFQVRRDGANFGRRGLLAAADGGDGREVLIVHLIRRAKHLVCR
jgi:hypothetical protein